MAGEDVTGPKVAGLTVATLDGEALAVALATGLVKATAGTSRVSATLDTRVGWPTVIPETGGSADATGPPTTDDITGPAKARMPLGAFSTARPNTVKTVAVAADAIIGFLFRFTRFSLRFDSQFVRTWLSAIKPATPSVFFTVDRTKRGKAEIH